MMVVSTYATLYAVEQELAEDPLPDQVRLAEIINDARKDEIQANFESPGGKIGTNLNIILLNGKLILLSFTILLNTQQWRWAKISRTNSTIYRS